MEIEEDGDESLLPLLLGIDNKDKRDPTRENKVRQAGGGGYLESLV